MDGNSLWILFNFQQHWWGCGLEHDANQMIYILPQNRLLRPVWFAFIIMEPSILVLESRRWLMSAVYQPPRWAGPERCWGLQRRPCPSPGQSRWALVSSWRSLSWSKTLLITAASWTTLSISRADPLNLCDWRHKTDLSLVIKSWTNVLKGLVPFPHRLHLEWGRCYLHQELLLQSDWLGYSFLLNIYDIFNLFTETNIASFVFNSCW